MIELKCGVLKRNKLSLNNHHARITNKKQNLFNLKLIYL